MKRNVCILILICLMIQCLSACGSGAASVPPEQEAASESAVEQAADKPAASEEPELTTDSASVQESSSAQDSAPVDASSAEEIPAEEPASTEESTEEIRFVSEPLPGASAIYVSGETRSFDDGYFYGAGYADSDMVDLQVPNQFGYGSVVLAAGQGTDLTLNNPTILSDPQSYANGLFAAAMAKVTVNGGSITTDNENGNGHGVDVTYMGHAYLNDTVVHTSGETSGGLASDFGGGFIQGERLEVTTEGRSSPAVFCAGTTIVMLEDSRLTSNATAGVIVAHDHSVVALDNCEVLSAGNAIEGLQALPSPEASEGCVFFSYGGTITSRDGAVLGESGGRTEMNLVGTECRSDAGMAISVSSGILTVNLWDTELSGSIACAEGCTLVVNVFAGSKLSGEVTGDVEIHVYDGGAYDGSYSVVTESAEGAPAPEKADFDAYLLRYWGTGFLVWDQSKADSFVEVYEPEIIASSAASFAENGTASVAYDPKTYDPSENGVDLDALNVGGAHGFTEEEVFGGAESRTNPFAQDSDGQDG